MSTSIRWDLIMPQKEAVGQLNMAMSQGKWAVVQQEMSRVKSVSMGPTAGFWGVSYHKYFVDSLCVSAG